MVMLGAIGRTINYSTSDVTTLPSTTDMDISGARLVCVTVKGTASASGNIVLKFGLSGACGEYPIIGSTPVDSLTVTLTGTGVSTFTLNALGNVDGYSYLKINSITPSAGTVSSACVHIEAIY